MTNQRPKEVLLQDSPLKIDAVRAATKIIEQYLRIQVLRTTDLARKDQYSTRLNMLISYRDHVLRQGPTDAEGRAVHLIVPTITFMVYAHLMAFVDNFYEKGWLDSDLVWRERFLNIAAVTEEMCEERVRELLREADEAITVDSRWLADGVASLPRVDDQEFGFTELDRKVAVAGKYRDDVRKLAREYEDRRFELTAIFRDEDPIRVVRELMGDIWWEEAKDWFDPMYLLDGFYSPTEHLTTKGPLERFGFESYPQEFVIRSDALHKNYRFWFAQWNDGYTFRVVAVHHERYAGVSRRVMPMPDRSEGSK